MINTRIYYETMAKRPIETILKDLSQGQNDIVKGDYNYFIDFLKKEHRLTDFICEPKNHTAKIILEKLVNYFGLDGINIKELYELIKDNVSYELKRQSEWKSTEFQLISDSFKRKKFCLCFAEFKYVNKWGHSLKPVTYKLIHDNKHNYWPINRYDKLQFYILKSKNIYGISYKHKTITIYKCSKRI